MCALWDYTSHWSLCGAKAQEIRPQKIRHECPDCGWQANVVVKATNKPTSVKDAELMAEAKELADEEST